MKLWSKKETEVSKIIEEFTIGKDAELDILLAPYDVLGSIAHAAMLHKVGLLSEEEASDLISELRKIYREIEEDKFSIENGVEDVHSQVELMLTRSCGDTGKRIHTGRSRNDQVLVDLALFSRDGLEKVVNSAKDFFDQLIRLSEKHKNDLLPGYTHLQLAMPSSFGLWFSGYAESISDDMLFLHSAYRYSNKNPLGSAAGYGSSFPLDRTYTTELLGFESLHVNVINAQMSRGKLERQVLSSIASLAATLSRMAMDLVLYMNQHFNFVSFPENLTTGSSIMPHKKNPDVLELIRGKCNKLTALPGQIVAIGQNLPSGYHRDMQLNKEVYFPAFKEILDCLKIFHYMLQHIEVKKNLLEDSKYDPIFSVEAVNKLVIQGIPFRDAYKVVGDKIASGDYTPEKDLDHKHEGSIGNLRLDLIKKAMDEKLAEFKFQQKNESVDRLLKKEYPF